MRLGRDGVSFPSPSSWALARGLGAAAVEGTTPDWEGHGLGALGYCESSFGWEGCCSGVWCGGRARSSRIQFGGRALAQRHRRGGMRRTRRQRREPPRRTSWSSTSASRRTLMDRHGSRHGC